VTQPLNYAEPGLGTTGGLVPELEAEFEITGRYRNASRYFRKIDDAAQYVATRMRERLEPHLYDHVCLNCGQRGDGRMLIAVDIRIRQRKMFALSAAEGRRQTFLKLPMCLACSRIGWSRERLFRRFGLAMLIVGCLCVAAFFVLMSMLQQIDTRFWFTLMFTTLGVSVILRSAARVAARQYRPPVLKMIDTPETRVSHSGRRLEAFLR
jgi:hypothetical protein